MCYEEHDGIATGTTLTGLMRRVVAPITQGSSLRSQPWAGGRNIFDVVVRHMITGAWE